MMMMIHGIIIYEICVDLATHLFLKKILKIDKGLDNGLIGVNTLE